MIAKKLNAMGIESTLQLADASTTMIRKRFSVVIERTGQRQIEHVNARHPRHYCRCDALPGCHLATRSSFR